MLIFAFFAALAIQCACWVALCVGLRTGLRRLSPDSTSHPSHGRGLPPITVVVAARDEADRLPILLAALQAQTHAVTEIVVVDDGSSDATPQILEEWRRRVAHLRVVRRNHDPGGGSKKRALETGIAAASYELLAFTDADCAPPPEWLETLAGLHASRPVPTMFVGYSPFRTTGPSLVGLAARYETFVTGVLTAGAAGLGRPYMAVGRNLSYPRSVFEAMDGFQSIMHSMSGDDDLLVQHVARRSAADVVAMLDPATFVPTESPATWGDWLRQKRRHASAGRYYAPRILAALAMFHGSNLAVWLAPLFLGWIGAGVLGVRLAVQFAALRFAARLLGEEDLMPFQPLMEPLYLLYNTFAAPSALVFAPRRW